MPSALIQGLPLHYSLSGQPQAPVLVLAHSLGVSLDMWQPQIDALSPHFHLLRYDVRGHGASGIPTAPATVEQIGRDLLGLLDHLGIERIHFCGLSMGGSIGQWLGVNAPSRLRRLVLANTAAKIGSPETWNPRIALVEREGLAPVIPGTLERWFTPAFHAAHPEVIASTRSQLEATAVSGYTACCAAVRDADFRATATSISVPTLVLTGTHDPVTPPADARWLADQIPHARYLELPAAHLSSVEASESFNQALLAFLL